MLPDDDRVIETCITVYWDWNQKKIYLLAYKDGHLVEHLETISLGP